MNGCLHQGFHSGQGRYDASSETLRYIVICDSCGEELREVLVQTYTPEYDAKGNDGFISIAA
jgi:hypothetical protein